MVWFTCEHNLSISSPYQVYILKQSCYFIDILAGLKIKKTKKGIFSQLILKFKALTLFTLLSSIILSLIDFIVIV